MSRTDGPISVLLRSFEGGGAERVAVNLANGFAAEGFDVEIVVQYDRGPYRSLVDNSIEVVELGRRVRYGVPKLVSHLRASRPSSLLAVTTEVNVFGIIAWKLASLPGRVVATECNSLTSLPMSRRRAIEKSYPHADSIVAKSEQMRAEVIDYGIEPGKVVTIHNPVPPELHAHRKQRDRQTGPQRLIAVGRLTPQKDYPNLIAAFDLLRKDIDVTLLILGIGPEEAHLKELVHRRGLERYVTFGGFVDPPWEAMAESSALVLSSRWEGWPGVLVEAMTLGVPVVSTDCPTGPAEILDNGRLGPLVPVSHPEALASAVHHALTHPVGAAELQARTEQWSLNRIVPQYLQAMGMPSGHVD